MRKAWDPTQEAEAAEEMVYLGVTYARGARFPHQDLGLDGPALANLWRARKIEFTGAPYVTRRPDAKPQPVQQQRR